VPAPLWFLLEAVLGTLILLWGRKQLRVVLEHWPAEKTDTNLPIDDAPNPVLRKFGFFLSLVAFLVPFGPAFLLWLRDSRPQIEIIWILFLQCVFCLQKFFGSWLYERLERQKLSSNHPWRLELEWVASQQGIVLQDVYFISSNTCRPYVVAGNGITIPSRVLRDMSSDVREFLTIAALHDVSYRFVYKRRLLYFSGLLLWVAVVAAVAALGTRIVRSMLKVSGYMIPQFLGGFLETCPWEPQFLRERFALEMTNDLALAERSIRERWEMEKGRRLNPDEEIRFQKYLAKVGTGWTPKAAPMLPAPTVVAQEESAPVLLRRQ
jgi:hypothetical protein